MRKEALTTLGLGVVAYKIATGAFTSGSRKQILQRDGNQCVKCPSTRNLEASHIDHTKGHVNGIGYNDPRRGETLCTLDHYLDHVVRHGQEGLGLNDRQNNWAIKALAGRLPYR